MTGVLVKGVVCESGGVVGWLGVWTCDGHGIGEYLFFGGGEVGVGPLIEMTTMRSV